VAYERILNDSINIYVGATRPQLLSYLVLKHSIESNCTIEVLVRNLGELVNDNSLKRGTPFSLQRLFIPKLNNYEGVAIYLDSDMIVYGDIAEIANTQKNKEVVLGCKARVGSTRPEQFSVFRIDCSRAKHWVFNSEIIDNKFNTNLDFEESKRNVFNSDWNSLEYYIKGQTKLLHYTDMDKQPWISSENELRDLWYEQLSIAVTAGYISKQVILNEIERGYVKPSLKRFCECPPRLPTRVERFLDQIYAPPHTVDRFFKSNNLVTRYLIGSVRWLKSNVFIPTRRQIQVKLQR